MLPVVEDVEIEINPADIKMEVFRSSGAGGQHINKTSSAVRLIHEPTGIVVECQTERSQFQNRDNAMKMLRTKLYEIEKQKQDSEVANARKSQVGSGDRSEKIRTYNYPQGRITDHRIGMSIYQMENFLNGDLDEMIDNLIAADRAERLQGEDFHGNICFDSGRKRSVTHHHTRQADDRNLSGLGHTECHLSFCAPISDF